MLSSIRARTLAWLAPEHRLRCRRSLWRRVLIELARRGRGEREAGAFLLGHLVEGRREICGVAYYDDLAPGSLVDGMIVFPSTGYGELWRRCREGRMQVVADVHTHPGVARQSGTDREHPMIAERGHVALIVPNFAVHPFRDTGLGIYEYMGGHRWNNRSGRKASHFFIRTWL